MGRNDDDDEGWEPMETSSELRHVSDRGDREFAKHGDEDKKIDLTGPRRDDDDDD